MQKVLVFLQNAWSPLYGSSTWPRRSWLQALERSRSGIRLKVLTEACPTFSFWFDNTTPVVGNTPDSVVPPDPEHLRTVITAQGPDILIACGKQAEKALGLYQTMFPTLILPHPAHRLVTNQLFLHAAEILNRGFTGIVTVRQDFQSVVVTCK